MKSNLENGPKNSNAAGKEVESDVKKTHKSIKQLISDCKKAKTQSDIDECNSKLDKIKPVAIGAGIATGAVVGTTFISGMIKSLTADAESVEREAKATQDFMNKAASGKLNKIQLGVWKAKGTLLGKLASKITQFGSFCGSKLASKNKYSSEMHDVVNANRSIYTDKSMSKKFSNKKAVDTINKISGNFGMNAIADDTSFGNYVSLTLDKLNISCEQLANLAKSSMNNISEYGANVLNAMKDKNSDITGNKEVIKKSINDAKSYLGKMSTAKQIMNIFLESEKIDELYEKIQNNGGSNNSASSVFGYIYNQIKNCIIETERIAIQCIDNGVLVKISNLPKLPKKSSGKRTKQPKVKKPVGDTSKQPKLKNHRVKKMQESVYDDYDEILESYIDL